MKKMHAYKLSDIAERDVSKIYDYTDIEHGVSQAVKYLMGLDKAFSALVEQPLIGKNRTEIREELRSFVYEKHTIFYRAMIDHIRIVRVLHSRCDLPKFL